MERRVGIGVVFFLLQVLSSALAESPPCSPGFDSELFVFRVHREHLHRGKRLGKVGFSDCSGRSRMVFDTTDKWFEVATDGTVKLKRQVTLHEGHKMFSVHAWDSTGKRHTAYVRVEHEGGRGQQEYTEAVGPAQPESPSTVLFLDFLKSSVGLRRLQGCMLIPPLSFQENDIGPFPKKMPFKIKSIFAKESPLWYSITDEGADQPPENLFTVDRNTGWMYVTKTLDREKKDKYQLQVQAVAEDGSVKELIDIEIVVIDQNDNKPVFTQDTFLGSVPEVSNIGFEIMTVTATDADDPNTDNADVRYTILSQIPALPYPNMFTINSVSGAILVEPEGLDREKYPEYTLELQAADLQGKGLTGKGKAIITVTDSNDHAPQFEKTSYNVSVPENKMGAVVVKMPVTDGDEPQSPAWAAQFRIINGNSGGFFNISTGPNKQEGIITTVKPLDFERNSRYTLSVIAENEVQFAKPLTTSTATVTVNVIDVNEAPVFDPEKKTISISENQEVGSDLTVYTANDPDMAKSQKVTYRVGSDPAGWLNVDKETGVIRVKSDMDRESHVVKDGRYEALILAMDNDPVPTTGTGTLVIELQDVNDNPPVIEERSFKLCNKQSAPVLLSVSDKDGPGFTSPYNADLVGDGHKNWTVRMNSSRTGIILELKTPLEHGDYNIVMRVFDSGGLFQDNSVQASVCDCTGNEVNCPHIGEAGLELSAILGILGAILALMLLVLVLLLFLRRKSFKKLADVY
ncbi:cadherin-1-like [Brachyhypopomus gauderio]|uniref:cadherin-1-like n=1 Tax=Brachyhypopomus gauderio TaxID=698409 RepID=UPI004040FE6D